jgi:hypothetical protein
MWRTPEETIDLSQVTDKIFNYISYMVVDILDFLIPEDLEDSQLIGQLKI